MSASAVPRRRTPVVCLAYGDEGLAWLRSLRRRCAGNPQIDALIEHGVVQFWCIGAADGGTQGIRTFKEVPTYVVVSEILAEARTARAMAEFPGLSVHSVTVLERVSLFAERAAKTRSDVFNVLEAVPEVTNLASSGQNGFVYDWVVFADSLHEPARVTKEMRAAAAEAALASTGETRTFLVDRLDTNMAVMDHDIASRCLLELAMSFIAGDLGAPRNDGVSVAIPDALARGSADTVIPFSVALVEHPWHEIERARIDAFLRSLANGVSDSDGVTRVAGSPSLLVNAITADVVALDEGRFDRHLRRVEREKAAQAAVAWALAMPQGSLMRDVLVSVKREIPRLLAQSGPSVPATPRAVQALQVGATFAGREYLYAGLAIAVAAGGVYLWRRSRQPAATPPAPAREQVPSDLRRDVAGEWEQLCGRLTAFLDYWQPMARSLSESRSIPEGAPTWRSAPPIAWRLTSAVKLRADLSVTPELCMDLGRHVVSDWHGAATLSDTLAGAVRHELLRWDNRKARGQSIIGEVLNGALADEQSRPVRGFLEARPYLANPSPPPVRDTVLWLCAPSLSVTEQLKTLEAASVRSSTAVLSHDDDSFSVRYVFARPVSWSLINSLAIPANDGK